MGLNPYRARERPLLVIYQVSQIAITRNAPPWAAMIPLSPSSMMLATAEATEISSVSTMPSMSENRTG
ncbi:hypothetical protein D3C75_1264790 [compost metagenome]